MKPKRLKKLIEMSKTPIIHQPPIDRDELGPMVRGYVEAMFFTTGLPGSVSDISERFLAQMIRDCVYFYNFNKHILDPLYALGQYKDSQCGHDFWLSRHHHGAGFFDHSHGGWDKEVWDELQQSAMGRFHEIEDYVYEHEGVIDIDYTIDEWGESHAD